jgi:hypothetical protein
MGRRERRAPSRSFIASQASPSESHALGLRSRLNSRASCNASPALVSFNIETLTAKIEEAGKLRLIGLVRRPHEKRSASIFDDLQSERWEVIKFEE